jgi:hypothetical protein
MGKDRRQQIYVGFVADIDIKILGVAPPGAGHAFPRQRHMCRGRGYLLLPGFTSLYDAIHVWMTRRMDGWKASRKTTMTSFTICNFDFEASVPHWSVTDPGLSISYNKCATITTN